MGVGEVAYGADFKDVRCLERVPVHNLSLYLDFLVTVTVPAAASFAATYSRPTKENVFAEVAVTYASANIPTMIAVSAPENRSARRVLSSMAC